MKSLLRIRTRTVIVGVCATAFAAGIATVRAQADQWDKRTTLTVNQTIQIHDTVLEPGKYIMKLADSSSNRHVVQIFNGDQTRIIDTILAIPKYRMNPTGDTQFAFWETPSGTARAMRAWYYPGDNMGQEFPYPKRLTQLAMARPESVPAPAPEPQPTATQPESTPVTAPAAEPEPTPAPQAQSTQPAEEPVQMAQNTPPPAPPAVTPETTGQEPAPARELPKTGSPYPLFGLAGISLLALYATLRLTRTA